MGSERLEVRRQLIVLAAVALGCFSTAAPGALAAPPRQYSWLTATADDGKGGRASASLTLPLLPRNLPPTIRINGYPLVVRAPLAQP